MDFEFFFRLNQEQAKIYLSRFLSETPKGIYSMRADLLTDSINLDYSLESIKPFFLWTLRRIKTIPKEKDETLPYWIKDSELYLKGLYSFDENSSVLVLRLAYYLGAAFVQNSNKLVWTTGRRSTAVVNMPVVSGFTKKMELAPMLISGNIVRNLIQGKNPEIIDVAISTWTSFT